MTAVEFQRGEGARLYRMATKATAGEARKRALKARQEILTAEAVLGRAILDLRAHGFTREDVASMLGMTVHAVRTFELGIRKTRGLKGAER